MILRWADERPGFTAREQPVFPGWEDKSLGREQAMKTGFSSATGQWSHRATGKVNTSGDDRRERRGQDRAGDESYEDVTDLR